jgi:acetyl-CoA/propionyl-CoA carboxylase biotin carboxyl carrier protein
MTVPQVFDSLIAKLIVTGADRTQALARARRALAEFEIGGMPTVLPFHRAVLEDPAFTSEPFTVHTRWIETEFAGQLPPYAGDDAVSSPGQQGRERVVVEVGGKRLEVVLPAGLGLSAEGAGGTVAAGQSRSKPGRRSGPGRGAGGGSAAGGDGLVSPMQGTIVKIVAENGQHVTAGEAIVVLEAMKMEQPLTAHKDGTVADLTVEVGQTVSAGQVICRLAD